MADSILIGLLCISFFCGLMSLYYSIKSTKSANKAVRLYAEIEARNKENREQRKRWKEGDMD